MKKFLYALRRLTKAYTIDLWHAIVWPENEIDDEWDSWTKWDSWHCQRISAWKDLKRSIYKPYNDVNLPQLMVDLNPKSNDLKDRLNVEGYRKG